MKLVSVFLISITLGAVASPNLMAMVEDSGRSSVPNNNSYQGQIPENTHENHYKLRGLFLEAMENKKFDEALSILEMAVEMGSCTELAEIWAPENRALNDGENLSSLPLIHKKTEYRTVSVTDYINHLDSTGHLPFNKAVEHQAYSLVEFMLKNGAKHSWKDGNSDSTPLAIAIKKRDWTMVQLLQRYNANIVEQDIRTIPNQVNGIPAKASSTQRRRTQIGQNTTSIITLNVKL